MRKSRKAPVNYFLSVRLSVCLRASTRSPLDEFSFWARSKIIAESGSYLRHACLSAGNNMAPTGKTHEI